jgi:SAM-dependent methyltransferase
MLDSVPRILALHRLRWPLPALLTWSAGWLAWWCARAAGLPVAWAGVAALAVSLGLALSCHSGLRRVVAAAGFPLSALALGLARDWPAWWWLLMLASLLLAYPLRAWRDAPFFPTPAGALDGLAGVVGTPLRVLDAGCGLGHGLRALRRQWPRAALEGVEWSPLLAWVAAWRCRPARVRRGDMWAMPWSGFDLVYLFQRPESMARAWEKAARELRPGAWLVSLEFPVPGHAPHTCLQGGGRRTLWIYRRPESAPRPALPAAPSGGMSKVIK